MEREQKVKFTVLAPFGGDESLKPPCEAGVNVEPDARDQRPKNGQSFDGAVALLGVEILGLLPAPFPCGVLTAVICLTVAIPEEIAAAAAIPPKTGPTIGIPANELNADCAPL
mgnify:CR=1 FL=1